MASGLLRIGHIFEKWQWRHNLPTWLYGHIFFDVILSSLVTGPSFMSISSLFLEFWRFSFIKDWPETWKLEILLSEFYPISGDWGKLGMPNLARMFLMKCYWILQVAKVKSFTFTELLRKNQQKGVG